MGRATRSLPGPVRQSSEENGSPGFLWFLRELIIPFGESGYVALFEIENRDTVTVLAARQQREEDYH